jgi:thiamine biosynthesis protein ThiC
MYELIKAAQKASAAQLPRAHSPSSLRSYSAKTQVSTKKLRAESFTPPTLQNFLEEMRRKQTHHFVEFCKVHAGLCWGFVETPRGQSRLVTIVSTVGFL